MQTLAEVVDTKPKHFSISHKDIRVGKVGDMVMPQLSLPLETVLEKVRDFEVRPDDVLLCSFPKSGTHWIYRVVDMLLRGSAEFGPRGLDSAFLDLQDHGNIEQLDSPRILGSHLPFELLPRQVKDKKTKIVYVFRHLKSVLTSGYCQVKGTQMMAGSSNQMTMDMYADFFFTPPMAYGGWFKHLEGVTTFMNSIKDHPVFILCYEKALMNPTQTVKDLAQFLGIIASQELSQAIADACSFKNQKETEEKLDPSNIIYRFYRKGNTDDWKNYITVALNERLDQMLCERAQSCPLAANYVM